MTNTIVRSQPSSLLSDLGLGSFFPPSMLERLMAHSMPQPNLMREYRKEDGSHVYEFNLAGFEENEISVKNDTSLNELIITAEHNEEGNMRRFATTLALSPYSSPEDISVGYTNGVLNVAIAPFEKRKEEAIIKIPLNRSSIETDASTES